MPTYVRGDMLVETARGARPIEQIAPGDKVLTCQMELKRVAEVLKKNVDTLCEAKPAQGKGVVTTADGDLLVTPWFNDNPERHRWESLNKIVPGKVSFVRFNGEAFLGVPGQKTYPVQGKDTTVYSLVLRDGDTFTANGFVVRAQLEIAAPD